MQQKYLMKIHRGEIKLLDTKLEIVQIRRYHGLNERKRIVETWRHLCGGRFQFLIIQIYPEQEIEIDEQYNNRALQIDWDK